MALSLTTVAWGITDKNTLPDPVGGVIELTTDLTVDFAGERVPALADGTVINGNGNTLTLNGNIGSYNTWAAITGKNLTVNNLKIVNNLTSARAVFVLEGGALNNVDVSGTGTVIMPVGSAAVTLTDCDFTGFTSAAILTDGDPATPVNLVDSTFEGTGFAIIVRNDDGSAVGCTFDAKVNLYADDSAAGFTGNTFNERVKLYTDDEVLTGNSFGTNGVIALDDPNLDVDASGNYWGGGAPSADQIPAAIADKVTVDTYATAVAADGTTSGLVSAAGVPMNAPANCNTKPVSLKDCVLVDLTNGAVLATFEDTDKATVYDFNDITTTTNGVKTTEYGATVYYFDGVYGLVVAKDYANAQLQLANGKFVYLRGISVAEFANASGRTTVVVDKFVDKADDTTKCGAATEDYAVVGKKFYAAEGDTLAYYKGEFVLIGAELDAEPLTPHGFMTGDEDCKWSAKDNKLTSVKCTCDDTFKVVQDIKGLKAGSYYALGDGNYVVLKATYSGGTVVTPSTDKVQSAETFDAGIAMYVGMSVMAAAGSAVVIGKKKD